MKRDLVGLLLCLSVIGWMASCGGGASSGGSSTTLAVGGTERRAVLLTDIDDVRDAVVHADSVYVATDRGVLRYQGERAPTRITEGLPSGDVTSLALGSGGRIYVGTSAGMATIQGTSVAEFENAPLHRIYDLAVTSEGNLWACGPGGLARYAGGQWSKFGENATCTKLAPAEDGVFAATTSGLWKIEGDVVREHIANRGLPEGYVRDVVPLAGGKIFVIGSGPSKSQFGYYDGSKWFAYTIRDFPSNVIAVTAHGEGVAFYTPTNVYTIALQNAQTGTRLHPLAAGRNIGSMNYRARITPAASVTLPAENENERLRGSQPLAEIPPNQATVSAPTLAARPLTIAGYPEEAYRVVSTADGLFVADRNRGVSWLPTEGEPKVLRTREMRVAADLKVCSDPAGRSWLVSSLNDLVMYNDGAMRRAPVPGELTVQAVAPGPGGAYMLARVGNTRSIRVFRSEGGPWSAYLERDLALDFVSIPFIGIANDGTVWAAIEIAYEASETGKRLRGVVALSRSGNTSVYHHRGATAARDGQGATEVPDEVAAIDFASSDTWFATLFGATRLAEGQAVVYGEARGVQGEVVNDVATGSGGRLWVAAADGVGYFEEGEFKFNLPPVVAEARPTALAIDSAGHLWGASNRGAIFYDGTDWRRLTMESGDIPTNDIRDIDIDGRDRVFFLTDEGVLVYTPTHRGTSAN